jgi:hypothetical protein
MRNGKTHFAQIPIDFVTKMTGEPLPEKTEPNRLESPGNALQHGPANGSELREKAKPVWMLPYDIFRTGDDGHPIWVEAVATVEAANALVRELAVVRPGEYFLLSQRSQTKIILNPNGTCSEQLKNTVD